MKTTKIAIFFMTTLSAFADSYDPAERKLFDKLFRADQEVTERVAKRQKALDQVTAYCKSKDMTPSILPGQIQAQCNPQTKLAPAPPVAPETGARTNR